MNATEREQALASADVSPDCWLVLRFWSDMAAREEKYKASHPGTLEAFSLARAFAAAFELATGDVAEFSRKWDMERAKG